MNTNSRLARLVLASVVGGLLSTGALAHVRYDEERTNHWIEHLATEQAQSATPQPGSYANADSSQVGRTVAVAVNGKGVLSDAVPVLMEP